MKKRKLTQADLEKYSVRTHLEQQFKKSGFAADYEEGVRALRLGYQVFLARKKSGLTQHVLAKRIGTRQANISRLERGEYNFTVEMLQKIASALHAKLEIQLMPAPDRKAA